MNLSVGKISDIVMFTRASGGTYFDQFGIMQVAAVNEWRRDHDPVTHEARGILIEEARTNQLMWSEAIDNAYWGKARSTVVPNADVAPNGTTTAQKLVETTEDGSHGLTRAVNLSDGFYTASVFVKGGGRNWFRMGLFYTGTSVSVAYFNVETGEIGPVGATVVSAAMQHVGGGWYRCSVTVNAVASTGLIQISMGTGPSVANLSYVGDGVSGLFVWGAQVEAGAFPTSYIPTTTAAATRAADSLVITNGWAAGWFNPAEGTFLIEYETSTPLGTIADLIDRSSGNNGVSVYENGSNPLAVVAGRTFYGSGGNNSLGFSGLYAPGRGKFARAAYAYDLAGQAVCVNGLPTQSQAMAMLPVSVAGNIHLGRSLTSGNRFLNGHIKRIAYFPRRLSNAELQEITA